MLYWTDEEATVRLSQVEGKCMVAYGEDMEMTTQEYFKSGPDRFYFTHCYKPKSREFDDVPIDVVSSFRKGKVSTAYCGGRVFNPLFAACWKRIFPAYES